MKIIKKSEKYIPVPTNHIICGKNTYFLKDTHKTWNNNNVLVIGTSGGGKTRSVVRPAILQAETSFVISDPKGTLYGDYKEYLESLGYNVIKMDFIHPEKSAKYNPILLCKSSQDIQKLAHSLTFSLVNSESRIDPFWDESTFILLCALIGYLVETDEISNEEKTIKAINSLLIDDKAIPGKQDSFTLLKNKMDVHSKRIMERFGKESWAYRRYRQFDLAPDKTHNTVCITSCAKLATFDTEEIQEMLSGNDFDFTTIGKEKTAVFVEVSDTDRSMDTLVNLFYTQMMNRLCSYADEECKDHRLPIPVQFILDDFATNARIDNFENMISNIRSRNISAMIMIQDDSQLRKGYGMSASTIVNNCSTFIYLGGSDPETAQRVSPRLNLPAYKILNMPVDMCYICRRGQEPIYTEHFDLEWFEKEKGYVLKETESLAEGNTKYGNDERRELCREMLF